MKLDLKFFSDRLLKSELLRSASVLLTGTVLAQLISLLLRPFLTRMFAPDSIGAFSVYMSLIGILTVITTLRYDDAIVLPRKDKDSVNLLTVSLVLNFVLCLIMLIVIILWGKKIIALLNIPTYFSISVLYLVPAGVFLYNTYQGFNLWLIRYKKYYSVSINKSIRRGSEGAAQIVFAFVKNPKGLIFSDIIGQFFNVIAAIFQSLTSGLSFDSVSVKKTLYVLKKYSDFPKYNLISTFMSTCGFLLPPLYISKYFTLESAGYFDTAKFLLSIPLIFVTASVSSVLLQKVSEKYNRRESFLSDIKPVILVVGIISLVEILTILIFGEGLFRMIFGDSYFFSGKIAKIMVWSFVFNFIVSTFTSIFISMRKIRVYSIFQIFYFISILSLLFFTDRDLLGFLKVYMFVEVACYLIAAALLITVVSRYEYSLRKVNL